MTDDPKGRKQEGKPKSQRLLWLAATRDTVVENKELDARLNDS